MKTWNVISRIIDTIIYCGGLWWFNSISHLSIPHTLLLVILPFVGLGFFVGRVTR